MTPEQAATELLRRRAARDSLKGFAKAIDVPGRPVGEDENAWIFDPIESPIAFHHEIIMDAVEKWATTRYGRLMIFAPPGSAKSSYASVVAPSYVMGKMPGSRFIFATYNQRLADKQSKRARQICRSPKFQSIFNTVIPKGFEGAEAWSLDNGSEFMAVGMLSGSTGNRATHLIIDDPVAGREDADSENVQKKTMDAYSDDLKTRLIPGGRILIIQTRWSEKDLSGLILPEDYDGRSGEVLCRDGQVWTILNIQAKAERADDPLGRPLGGYMWPEWFGPRHWEQFENNPSPAAQRTWSALFQQRPAADNGGQFERVWFDGGEDSSGRVCPNARYKVKDLPPLNRLRIFGASDWAVTEKTTADFTEHGIWGMDEHGVLWAMDWKWGQVNSEKAVELNIELIKDWKPIAWGGETGKDENAIQPIRDRRMVEERAMTTVELLPSNQDKVAKAASFRAMASMGRVRFPADSVFAERVIAQLVKFPAGAHDDAVDVCGHAGRMVDRMWKAPSTEKPPELPRFLHEIQSREIFALDAPARGGSGRI